jgi:limonene-1,2-epoxide hydrolase
MSRPDSSVLRRLHEAMNRHDLEAFLSCFHPQYRSEQPAHPDRAFGGVEQVRKNWSALFAGIRDFQANLVRWSSDGAAFWAEWEWRGTNGDGSPVLLRGVTIFGVEEDRIRWGRLYMEPVEDAGDSIDAAVQRMVAGGRAE